MNEPQDRSEWKLLASFCHTDDCCPQAWLDQHGRLVITDDYSYSVTFDPANPPTAQSLEAMNGSSLRRGGIEPTDEAIIVSIFDQDHNRVFMTTGQAYELLDRIGSLCDQVVTEQLS